MNKFLLSLAGGFLLTSLTQASDLSDLSTLESVEYDRFDEQVRPAPGPKNPCLNVKLSVDQNKAIKVLRASKVKANKELQKAIQVSRSNFVKAVSNKASTIQQANTLASQTNALRAKALESRSATQNEILFKVLRLEQRAPFLKCQDLRAKRNHHKPAKRPLPRRV